MSRQQGLPSNGGRVECYWCTRDNLSSEASLLLGILWSVVPYRQPGPALIIFLVYSYLITEHPFHHPL